MSKSSGSKNDGSGNRSETQVENRSFPEGIRLSKLPGTAPSLSKDMVSALFAKGRRSTGCDDMPWRSLQ